MSFYQKPKKLLNIYVNVLNTMLKNPQITTLPAKHRNIFISFILNSCYFGGVDILQVLVPFVMLF